MLCSETQIGRVVKGAQAQASAMITANSLQSRKCGGVSINPAAMSVLFISPLKPKILFKQRHAAER